MSFLKRARPATRGLALASLFLTLPGAALGVGADLSGAAPAAAAPVPQRPLAGDEAGQAADAAAADPHAWRGNARIAVRRAGAERGDVTTVKARGRAGKGRTRLTHRAVRAEGVAVGATYRAAVLVRARKKPVKVTLRVREQGAGQTVTHRRSVRLRPGAWRPLRLRLTTTLPDASLRLQLRAGLGAGRLQVDEPALVGVAGRTTPPPPPTETGFPDAASTGVQDGVALRASRGLTVTTDGAVVENLDISGQLHIRANNVTVRNVRVRSSDYYALYVTGSGARIEHVEVDGLGFSGTGGAAGIGGGGKGMTVVAADITGVENGVVPGSGSVVQDSWIHGLASPGDPHYDGIQMDGGLSDIRVVHNTIDMSEHSQTAAVMVDNYFGPISRISVTGNQLLGGGYTVYADGSFSSSDAVSAITYADNVFGKGHWGYGLLRNADVTWSNNTDLGTGRAVRARSEG
ncbi:right-handed parallel beta-helix repeat-containing protein [Nocardioides solisilvae]|uniref:right-handed parallel beta-helix repeat-containing protein n=1 Tax=Nocardioides solisilvae TaxID=1542435 RepID=UPI000D745763|nr:right-handed parallel beta-helix repeat-containing protein [Nocardioides solisilvae]